MFFNIIAALGGLLSVAGAAKQQKAEKEVVKKQQQQQTAEVRQQRRQAIRAAQIQRAQAQASAVGSGAAGGSGAQGGIGSISSQLATSFGHSTQMSGLSRDITKQYGARADGAALSGIGSSVFSFAGGQLFQNTGGFGAINLNPPPVVTPPFVGNGGAGR